MTAVVSQVDYAAFQEYLRLKTSLDQQLAQASAVKVEGAQTVATTTPAPDPTLLMQRT